MLRIMGKDPETGMQIYPVAHVWVYVPATPRWEHMPPLRKGQIVQITGMVFREVFLTV
jgi:hypothetical protein